MDEHLADPTTTAVDTLANNAERIKAIRLRLSDPSWFMKALCEPIARLANLQDNVARHFWEGRFKVSRPTKVFDFSRDFSSAWQLGARHLP